MFIWFLWEPPGVESSNTVKTIPAIMRPNETNRDQTLNDDTENMVWHSKSTRVRRNVGIVVQPQTIKSANTSTDQCVRASGSKVEILHELGTAAMYEFDLCSVINCGNDEVSWRGYEVYMCTLATTAVDVTPWCEWVDVFWSAAPGGWTATADKEWEKKLKNGITLRRGQMTKAVKGQYNPLEFTISGITQNPYPKRIAGILGQSILQLPECKGQSSVRDFYLVIGVNLSGTDKLGLIKIKLITTSEKTEIIKKEASKQKPTPTPGTATLTYDTYTDLTNASKSQIEDIGAAAPQLPGVKITMRVNKTDDWLRVATGVSGTTNNWLLMIEQAAKEAKSDCIACMAARPLFRVVPAAVEPSCLLQLMNSTNLDKNCSQYDKIFPLSITTSKTPLFNRHVAPDNFTCINRTEKGAMVGNLNKANCSTILQVKASYRPTSRADVWWWCGENKLYDRFPRGNATFCALVSLIVPVSVFPTTVDQIITTLEDYPSGHQEMRHKRDTDYVMHADPTYVDAIGVPRGVPDEYKLVDQVAAGFESTLCWWCTINKNVDRINYVHYNVQRLGNMTASGFGAVHDQLKATSIMAFQTRIATDMLLANAGGVCSMFGEACCTFIPNNTAEGGSLTRAIDGLHTLNKKMKEHSGVDTTMWESWMNVFGRYKALVASALISIAVFAAILTLCGCCCIPCIRALVNRLITTAITPQEERAIHLNLLSHPDGDSDEEADPEEQILDLFSEKDDCNNMV